MLGLRAITQLFACGAMLAEAGTVWPKPLSVDTGDVAYQLAPKDHFSFTSDIASTTLWLAFSRYRTLIFNSAPQSFVPADKLDGVLAELHVHVDSEDETLEIGTTDESYTLVIDKDTTGGVCFGALYAKNVYGALRGLESFSQLIDGVEDNYGSLAVSNVKINDKPRFGFRGLLIDTSRHFLPTKTILSILDGMAYNKMNVLHWHIVDDQSFPFYSRTLPQITIKGAYSLNHIYTEGDMHQIISYAKHRGIDVMVELDTPGHTLSWGKGEPNLLTKCFNTTTGEQIGLGPLDPTKEVVYDAVETVFSDAARVFPSKLFHLGGDEVDFSCWKSNPDVASYMKEKGIKNEQDLQTYYMNRVIGIAEKLGKTALVWQEVFDNKGDLHKDAIVHVWRNGRHFEEEVKSVTDAGFRAVVSSPWYLDDLSDYHDWAAYLDIEIASFAGHSHPELVLGGEACMWGEYVDSTNILSRIFPRASSVAERLWSSYNTANIDEATSRLNEWRCKMVARGLQAQPLHAGSYCPHEWDEDDVVSLP